MISLSNNLPIGPSGMPGMPGMPQGGNPFSGAVQNFLQGPGDGGSPMNTSEATGPSRGSGPSQGGGSGDINQLLQQSLMGGGGSPSDKISPFQPPTGDENGTSTSKNNSSDTDTSGGSGKSPTVQEFDSAAKAPYGIPAQGDLKPLEQNGKPVTETLPSGMVGQAYVTPDNKVIVSFGGTGSGMGSELPGQLQADVVGGAGGVSQAQTDAAKFTQQVQGIADQQGIGAENVYVTGHSLGGMEAQYAAAQTGAGGMSFEAPGSTSGSNPKGDGSNFVNVSDQSDPIANIGRHYGQTLSVNTGQGILAHLPGAQDSQLPLSEELTKLTSSLAG